MIAKLLIYKLRTKKQLFTSLFTNPCLKHNKRLFTMILIAFGSERTSCRRMDEKD